MAESKNDVGKKLNTSAKLGGSPPAKGNMADAEASKPKGLLDELDSKLDDLFGFDEKETKEVEGRQIIKLPFDDVKETPVVQKTAVPDKNKTGEIKTVAPDPPAATMKKTAEPSNKKSGSESPVKDAIGITKPKVTAAEKLKPIIAKTKSASMPEKTSPTKYSKTQVPVKPVESKKEPKKADPRQGKKKSIALKLAICGIILIGGMIALLTFFQTPDPSRQSQPIAAPTVYKIIKPPAKAPETKTTPPAEQSVPQRPESTQIQQDASPAAVAADEKKPVPPAKPEINAADEINVFLQEWKTAWEKSAGEKGDTGALMSFYADDFTSNGLDKNRWRQDKAVKNRRKEWIRIELDKINIVGPLENERYEARFTLTYQSSNYADTSDQVLILKKETSGLKIIGTEPLTPSSYPYSIHDGSYRTLPPAREAVETYRKMGLEAYWTSVDLGEKGSWYRVFIGYYPDLESALRMIAAKGIDDVRPEETRYANLIGTYASEDDLQRQSRLIAESGYSPYVIMNDNGSLNLYVGAHATLKNAEKFSTELSARGISSRTVER